ncbi:unnamed protein product [Peniophora sp. CBMAI 1063]|nr:unnamed protein product [Peniophora sp. CBMAI 1063]
METLEEQNAMAGLRAMAARAVEAGMNAFAPEKWPRDSRAYWSKSQNVFAHRLRADPVGQLQHIRKLWKSRRRGKISTDSELFRVMDVLGERFVNSQEYTIARSLACHVDTDLGFDFWEACVKTELLSLLVEIVTDSEFSGQPREWMEYVLQCLTGFLSVWCQDVSPQSKRLSSRIPSYDKPMPKPQIKAFMLRLEEVCQSLWNVRETLHKGARSCPPRLSAENEASYRMYLLEVFIYGVSFLLKSKLHIKQGPVRMLVFLSTYAWTRQGVDSPSFLNGIMGEMWDSGGALEIFAEYDGEGVHIPEMMLEVGFEPILEHINAGIQGPAPGVHPIGGRLFQFVYLAKLMLNNAELLPKAWPAFCKFPLLKNISDAYQLDVKRRMSERKDVLDELGTWLACFIHLALSLKALVNHEIQSGWVRAGDVMFMYARGFKLALTVMQRNPQSGGLDPAITKYLLMTIESLFEGINNYKLDRPNGLPASLVNDLRSNASRQQWNATLLSIRDARSYGSLYPEYQLIDQWWTRFGAELGFSEGAAESQREQMHFCASPSCPLHNKPSAEPLRICTGCRQMYYCSPACQKLDWKAGHRTKCRELSS